MSDKEQPSVESQIVQAKEAFKEAFEVISNQNVGIIDTNSKWSKSFGEVIRLPGNYACHCRTKDGSEVTMTFQTLEEMKSCMVEEETKES